MRLKTLAHSFALSIAAGSLAMGVAAPSAQALGVKALNWQFDVSQLNADVQIGPITLKPQNFQVLENSLNTVNAFASLPSDLVDLSQNIATDVLPLSELPSRIGQDINVHVAALIPVDGLEDQSRQIEGYAEVSYRPSFGRWTPFFAEARFMGSAGYQAPRGDIDLKLDNVFYTFGYSDWRNDTLEIKYSNFSGEDWIGEISHPAFGAIDAKYKFGLNNDQLGPLALDENTRLQCFVGGEVYPRWRNAAGAEGSGKALAKSGCTLAIWKRLFVDAGASFFVNGEQDPGERDYFYAFGWSDWRPGKLNVVYENYANNRFPWNDAVANTANFWDGTIKVSMNFRPFDKRKY